MNDTTTASAVFSNRRAAQRAAQRLVEGGFARDSVEMRRLYSDDDDYEVSVQVRQGNVQRADDLLRARRDVHDFSGNKSNVGSLVLLAGALAAGVAGYTLYALADRRRSTQEKESRRNRRS
jgi:hypothetical protein